MPVCQSQIWTCSVRDERYLLGRVLVGGGKLVLVHPGDELRVLRRALLQRQRRLQLLRSVLLELLRRLLLRRRLLQRCGRGVLQMRLSALGLSILRLLPVVCTLLVGGGRVLVRLLRRRVLLLGQVLGRWRLLLPVRLRRRKALADRLLLLLLILRFRRRRLLLLSLLRLLGVLGVLRQVVVGVGPRGRWGRRVVLRPHSQAGRRRLGGSVAGALLPTPVLVAVPLLVVILAAALLLQILLLATPASASAPCSSGVCGLLDRPTGSVLAGFRGMRQAAQHGESASSGFGAPAFRVR